MVVKVSSTHKVAVDQDYFWQPLETCPRGANVWLLTKYGKSIEGMYAPGDKTVVAWCPRPKVPEWAKALMK